MEKEYTGQPLHGEGESREERTLSVEEARVFFADALRQAQVQKKFEAHVMRRREGKIDASKVAAIFGAVTVVAFVAIYGSWEKLRGIRLAEQKRGVIEMPLSETDDDGGGEPPPRSPEGDEGDTSEKEVAASATPGSGVEPPSGEQKTGVRREELQNGYAMIDHATDHLLERVRTIWNDGVQNEYIEYDAEGNPVQYTRKTTKKKGDGTLDSTEEYTAQTMYDAEGRPVTRTIKETRRDNAGNVIPERDGTLEQAFTYDTDGTTRILNRRVIYDASGTQIVIETDEITVDTSGRVLLAKHMLESRGNMIREIWVKNAYSDNEVVTTWFSRNADGELVESDQQRVPLDEIFPGDEEYYWKDHLRSPKTAADDEPNSVFAKEDGEEVVGNSIQEIWTDD